ncbi:MAG: hypothetical protein AVDCRST_MAG30-1710, partial [uncultured Solirubrobacteraceae bacterium]
ANSHRVRAGPRPGPRAGLLHADPRLHRHRRHGHRQRDALAHRLAAWPAGHQPPPRAAHAAVRGRGDDEAARHDRGEGDGRRGLPRGRRLPGHVRRAGREGRRGHPGADGALLRDRRGVPRRLREPHPHDRAGRDGHRTAGV